MKNVILCTIFAVMWCFTFFVELCDVYYLVNLAETIHEFEMNPVGRFLIYLDGGQVGLFAVSKMLFMSSLLMMMPYIFYFRRTTAMFMQSVLFSSRLLLFGYLMWGSG